MLLALQLPFADLRPFSPDETGRLTVPAWPLAEPDKEFVRGFGVVTERARGGVDSWAGEEVYCRASRAVKFAPRDAAHASQENGSSRISAKCAFRRLLYDGSAVGRLEVGLAFGASGSPSNTQGRAIGVVEMVEQLATAPVRIKSVHGHEVQLPLVDVGATFIERYARATTRADWVPRARHGPSLVRAGAPLAILEYRAKQLRQLPTNRRVLATGDASIALSFCRVVRGKGRDGFGVWLIGHGDGVDRDRLRQLRIHLLRLHAEKEALRLTLRAMIDRSIAITPGSSATDDLADYLEELFKLLTKHTRFGLAQSPLLGVAQQFDDQISMGERDTLLSQLSRLKGRLDRTMQRFSDASGRIVISQGANATAYVFPGGSMSGNTYNVSGGQVGAVGDNATASNNTFVQNNALAPGVDLAVLATELEQLRTRMREEARTPAEDRALAAVGEAQEAAKKNDRAGVVKHLKAAGAWALDAATKIGVALATAVLKETLTGRP
ncbi:MAG: hypothetical protein IT359_16285 [Gemmatimonadaceae bacterium]|nr:hypothetical protein [Gemmatimonadaceae bacterium]